VYKLVDGGKCSLYEIPQCVYQITSMYSYLFEVSQAQLPLKRRIKSHLLFADIIRSSLYSPH